MRALTWSALSALAVALLAWPSTYAVAPPELSSLGNFSMTPEAYRVDPYIELATELQALDHSAALVKLHLMAREPQAAASVIILSRMLFVPQPGADLRRPMIGGALFLGGTSYGDWPREPIEVVDGIPFLIANGYMLAGLPESDEAYLQYCETQGEWSSFHYTLKTRQQKHAALNELLASHKWKATLSDGERKFLSDQIE